MRKWRGPLWWYELRFGVDWKGLSLVGLIAVVVVAAIFAGVPRWLPERQKAMEETCVATGGHIERDQQPGGGTFPPLCTYR